MGVAGGFDVDLDGVSRVVGEVKVKYSGLPASGVSEKISLYKDSFDEIGSILNKDQNIGTKDTSYNKYLPLFQSWVKTSTSVDDLLVDKILDTKKSGKKSSKEAIKTQSTNKLLSIYESYFNELSKELEKFGVNVSGAAIGGSVGHTIQSSALKEVSFEEVD